MIKRTKAKIAMYLRGQKFRQSRVQHGRSLDNFVQENRSSDSYVQHGRSLDNCVQQNKSSAVVFNRAEVKTTVFSRP